jgi:transposase-like protein
MTSMNTTSLVLKQDRRGRVRTPAARREELLAEFARSGLSGARFAAMVGVRYQTFMGWVHQQRQGTEPRLSPAADRPRFAEAVVAAPSPRCPVIIELAAGIKLELHHAGQVPLACELLKALARPC